MKFSSNQYLVATHFIQESYGKTMEYHVLDHSIISTENCKKFEDLMDNPFKYLKDPILNIVANDIVQLELCRIYLRGSRTMYRGSKITQMFEPYESRIDITLSRKL